MTLRCRIFGHTYYHLGFDRPCHCSRCGKCNAAWFDHLEALDKIANAHKEER